MAGPPIVAELAIAALRLDSTAALAVRGLALVTSVACVFSLVVRPLLAQLAAGRLASSDASDRIDQMRSEMELRNRVDRALGQASADTAAMRAALRAVTELVAEADVTLLLAVPDEPRVGWTVRLGDGELQPARSIPGTPGCSALVANSTVSTDSTSLDSCEHLEDPDMAVSSTCIPLVVGDRTLGVISAVQAPGEGPDDETLALMEWVVERTAARISEIHRTRRAPGQFAIDETTGLPGRDALDAALRENFRSLVPFCLALVEIDDFEGVQYLHSPEEVSEVSRTVADSLRLTVRPDDIVTSLDNGRFAVLLLNCGAAHASMAIERVRESLVLSLSVAEAPPFSFSAGVVESHRATSIDDLVEKGRAAVRVAHGEGGNRVALANE